MILNVVPFSLSFKFTEPPFHVPFRLPEMSDAQPQKAQEDRQPNPQTALASSHDLFNSWWSFIHSFPTSIDAFGSVWPNALLVNLRPPALPRGYPPACASPIELVRHPGWHPIPFLGGNPFPEKLKPLGLKKKTGSALSHSLAKFPEAT